jgi:hypothetical protein
LGDTLQKSLQCPNTIYFVQSVPNSWNAVSAKVRHEQQMFSASAIKRLDAHNGGVRDNELLLIVLRRRNQDDWAK